MTGIRVGVGLFSYGVMERGCHDEDGHHLILKERASMRNVSLQGKIERRGGSNIKREGCVVGVVFLI